MPGFIDRFLDRIEKRSPIAVAVLILSGLILFLPEHVLQHFHLPGFPERICGIVATIFWLLLLSFACAFLREAWRLFLKMREKHSQLQLEKEIERANETKICTLSEERRKILKIVLDGDELLSRDDLNVLYLVEHGFIRDTKKVYKHNQSYSQIKAYFKAEEWVESTYNKKPQILNN